MQTTPFKRAHMMMAAISAAMALGNTMLQKTALDAISPYKSRGHGKGLPSKNFIKKAGKYKPHQGKRECARRMRQMAAKSC